MRKILDAWAILAWLHDEGPPALVMEQLLDDAEAGAVQLSMSMINVGEVYYRLVRRRGPDEARAFLDSLKNMSIRTLPVPKSLVIEAAEIKGRHAISYADAFAVATAVRERAPLVSGDPELLVFRQSGFVEIEWIG